jgi:hypothetical protein
MTDESLRRSLAGAERLRHGDVVAEPRIITNAGVVAQYGARVLSPVEQAYRRRLISHRQHYAAERIYTSYAVGIAGIRQAPAGVAPSSPDGALMAAAAAASDYRACRDHVGPRLWPALFSYVVEEESAGNIAKRSGTNPTGMMALLCHALDVAADYFRLPVE